MLWCLREVDAMVCVYILCVFAYPLTTPPHVSQITRASIDLLKEGFRDQVCFWAWWLLSFLSVSPPLF